MVNKPFKHFHPTDIPHLAGAMNLDGVTYEPETLQIPGDVTTIGELADMGLNGATAQDGKLDTAVTVKYPDQHQIVFPKNTRVRIYQIPEQDTKVILRTDAHGQPFVVGPAEGGRRRRSTRRRRSVRRITRKH